MLACCQVVLNLFRKNVWRQNQMGWSENAGLTQHFPKMFFASKRGCYSNSRFIAVTGAQLLPPSKYDWEFWPRRDPRFYVINGIWSHPSPHAKRHLNQFSRFCMVSCLTDVTNRQTDRHTDHATSVTIGRIVVSLYDAARWNITVVESRRLYFEAHKSSNSCISVKLHH